MPHALAAPTSNPRATHQRAWSSGCFSLSTSRALNTTHVTHVDDALAVGRGVHLPSGGSSVCSWGAKILGGGLEADNLDPHSALGHGVDLCGVSAARGRGGGQEQRHAQAASWCAQRGAKARRRELGGSCAPVITLSYGVARDSVRV